MDVKKLFKSINCRPVAFYPVYAKIMGSVSGGVFLSQLMYWYSAMDGDEFYKTDEEILKETCLSIRELREGKKRLKTLDFVKITLRGAPPKTHYNIDFDKLASVIINLNDVVQIEINDGVRIESNDVVQNLHYTENTSEITTEREGEKPPTHQNGFSKKPAVSQTTGAQKKLEYNPDILANPENYTTAEIRNEAGNLAEKYVQEVFAPAWTLKTGQPYIPTFGDVAERMLAALFESCISRKINIADLFRARLNNFFNSNTGYYKDRRYSLKTFCEDFNTLTEPKHDKKPSGWVTC